MKGGRLLNAMAETTNPCGSESVTLHSTARRVDSKTRLTTIDFTPNGCSGRFISLRYYVCCSSLRQTLNRSLTLGMNAVPSGVYLLFCLVSAYTVLMFWLDEVLRASQSFLRTEHNAEVKAAHMVLLFLPGPLELMIIGLILAGPIIGIIALIALTKKK